MRQVFSRGFFNEFFEILSQWNTMDSRIEGLGCREGGGERGLEGWFREGAKGGVEGQRGVASLVVLTHL